MDFIVQSKCVIDGIACIRCGLIHCFDQLLDEFVRPRIPRLGVQLECIIKEDVRLKLVIVRIDDLKRRQEQCHGNGTRQGRKDLQIALGIAPGRLILTKAKHK